MKISDYIVEYLHRHKVSVVFGYMGGMVTHLADSINKYANMTFIQTYHEQSAAFAAVGYAKYTNRLGVAIATSGPGATNLITGIADAYFDSVAVLFITGQVNVYEYKFDKPIRQHGFQETNIVEMVAPITKYARFIDKHEDIPAALKTAIKIATTGRKGPVLLDIPMNVQREFLSNIDFKLDIPELIKIKCNELNKVVEFIKNAERPLFLLGGGVSQSDAIYEVQKLINKFQIPFISSLLGKSACDEEHPLYVGTIGSYGNRCANIAVANADLLIVLGSRLDVRQTGGKLDSFVINGSVIQIDIDENELTHSRISKNKLNIVADIRGFANSLLGYDIELKILKWHEYLIDLKDKYSQYAENKRNPSSIAPYELMEILNRTVGSYDLFCLDVGQHQMWAMQMLRLKNHQRLFTSGGLGAMGSCIPTAVGIAFAKNDNVPIYAINGDGGTHMSSQSLMLISQYNLPIKIIIINNKVLGMITQFQELYFNKTNIGTDENGGYRVPNFAHMAAMYDLTYFKIDATNNMVNQEDLKGFFGARNCILEYVVDSDCRVFPKLEYDQPIYNPSPILEKIELDAAMLVK